MAYIGKHTDPKGSGNYPVQLDTPPELLGLVVY
jgi:hypothetical protein